MIHKVLKKKSRNNLTLYDLIKTNIKDTSYIDQIMKSPETTNIIIEILEKQERKFQEIYILKEYLKRLKKFMEILNVENSNISIESLLSKVSNDMQLEKFEKNTFLMRIGEKGNNFYFTLSGNISILAPKELMVYWDVNSYLKYLKFLYNNKEIFLLKKTVYANETSLPFPKEKYEIEEPTFIVNNLSLDEYLKIINGENLDFEKKKDDDSDEEINHKSKIQPMIFIRKYKLIIYGYKWIVDLGRGSTFGEIALINENNKRTATIFVKSNSVFGTLSANSFKESMLVFLEKIKWEKIFFIFNTPLFKKMHINDIVKKYWNFFVEKKLKRNEILFEKNDIRNNIYFILKGSIKLVIPQCTLSKINEIIADLKNIYNDEIKQTSEKKDIVISVNNKGEILGMNDCVIDNDKFFFNAICDTDIIYYVIDMQTLMKILNDFDDIKSNYNKLNDKKTSFMINRLENIKRVFLNSMEGEIKTNILNLQLENIKNIFTDNKINYKQEKKKLDKIFVGNLNISKNKRIKNGINIKYNLTYSHNLRKKNLNTYTTLPKINFDSEKSSIAISRVKTYHSSYKNNLMNEKNISSLEENSFMKDNKQKLNKKYVFKIVDYNEKNFHSLHLKKILEKDDISKLLIENKLCLSENIQLNDFKRSHQKEKNLKKNNLQLKIENKKHPIKLLSFNPPPLFSFDISNNEN